MATAAEIANYESIVVKTALKQGVPQVNAKLIASQAAHETGKFTSNNFRISNNLFGMAVPRVRKSPYILGAGSVSAPKVEGGFSYAKYASIQDSVKDLVHWLHYNNVIWSNVNTPDKYAAWLKSRGYYTADQGDYAAALNGFYDKIKSKVYNNPGTTILLVVAVGVIAYAGFIYYNRQKLA